MVKSEGPAQECGELPTAAGHGKGKQARVGMGDTGMQVGTRSGASSLTAEVPQPEGGRHTVVKRDAKRRTLKMTRWPAYCPQHRPHSWARVSVTKATTARSGSTVHHVGSTRSMPCLPTGLACPAQPSSHTCLRSLVISADQLGNQSPETPRDLPRSKQLASSRGKPPDSRPEHFTEARRPL